MAKEFSKPVKEYAVPVKTVFTIDQTIDEALRHLRGQKIDGKIIYFYVVDDAGVLRGVVNTRNLLLRDPKTAISDIMSKEVIALKEEQTLGDAIELLSHHSLLALPVVDSRGCLLGIVDVGVYLEESIDIALEKQRNDIFQILGFTIEERKQKSAWKSFRLRMPWILCNMASGIACAAISRIFEGTLAKILLLAMFIPLVLTLSESISMQSMTQSIHLLRKSKINLKKLLPRFLSEWKVVLLLSSACGISVGLLSFLWGGGVGSALSITISLAISIAISASAGALIPVILHAKELDPKVASGPIVLMFADVITTLLYLGLATWMLV